MKILVDILRLIKVNLLKVILIESRIYHKFEKLILKFDDWSTIPLDQLISVRQISEN